MVETARAGDLVLSEQFHRLKRTALIFCSIIIVTVVPGVDITAATQSLWAPFKAVSHAWALLLLYGGATYYALGFLGEYIAAHRLNAELLIDRTGPHLAYVLKEADRVASAALDTLNAAVNGLPGVTAPEIIKTLRHDMAARLEERFPPFQLNQVVGELGSEGQDVSRQINDLKVPKEAQVILANGWAELSVQTMRLSTKLLETRRTEMLNEIRQGTYGAGSSQPLASLIEAVRAQRVAVDELRGALPGLRRPLATLNLFGTARTLTFWLWEGLAVAVMWVVATVIFALNAPELIGMVWWFQA